MCTQSHPSHPPLTAPPTPHPFHPDCSTPLPAGCTTNPTNSPLECSTLNPDSSILTPAKCPTHDVSTDSHSQADRSEPLIVSLLKASYCTVMYYRKQKRSQSSASSACRAAFVCRIISHLPMAAVPGTCFSCQKRHACCCCWRSPLTEQPTWFHTPGLVWAP